MGRRLFTTKSTNLSIVLASVMILATACGKFSAKDSYPGDRPPTTSNPETANERERWYAGYRLQKTADLPIHGKKEFEDVYSTMIEEKPTMTDDQRAEEAQRQYDLRQAREAKKAEAKKKSAGEMHDWAPGPSKSIPTTSDFGDSDEGADGTLVAPGESSDNGASAPTLGTGTASGDDSGAQLPIANTPGAPTDVVSTANPAATLASEPAPQPSSGATAPQAGGPSRPIVSAPSVPQLPEGADTSEPPPEGTDFGTPSASAPKLAGSVHDVANGPGARKPAPVRAAEQPTSVPLPPTKPAASRTAPDSGLPATAPLPPRRVYPASNPPVPFTGNICALVRAASKNGNADFSGLYSNEVKVASEIPADQTDALQAQTKKDQFTCLLLPVAIRLNMEVYRQRLEILRLRAKEKAAHDLTEGDQKWLSDIKVAYNLKATDSYDELLARVDIIPLPLLLAQAANETGWGTSKAAHVLKNLFGIHAWRKDQACEYGYDTGHSCVRKYKTISSSVGEFISLLNSDQNYKEFRRTRLEMRLNGEPINSDRLAQALGHYNENPAKYIHDVRGLLAEWDKRVQYKFDERAAANSGSARK